MTFKISKAMSYFMTLMETTSSTTQRLIFKLIAYLCKLMKFMLLEGTRKILFSGKFKILQVLQNNAK